MKKSIWITYLFIWISIGFYMYFWFYGVLEFINQKYHTVKFKTDKIIIGLLFYQLVYIILFSIFYSLVQTSSGGAFSSDHLLIFIFLWLMSLGFFVTLSILNYKISKNIAGIEKGNGISKLIKPGISILLFFLYFTSFPYIQIHINRIIDHEEILD